MKTRQTKNVSLTKYRTLKHDKKIIFFPIKEKKEFKKPIKVEKRRATI